jgi:ketosteroid isomerase-like protein
MNEPTNTQLVQQAYQSIKAGDIPSFLTLLAHDVQWQMPRIANVPFAGTWQGREQVGEFFRKMPEVQDIVEFEPEHFIAQGDKVVVLGRFCMHVKATGRDSRSEWVHIWTAKDGAITHMREYVDTAAVSRAYMVAPTA